MRLQILWDWMVKLMSKTLCIILVGCSSVGKDRLLSEVLKANKNIKPVISHTSRPIREGCEIDGREYHFVDDRTMLRMIENDEFVETRSYNVANGDTWHYGISKNAVKEGCNITIVDYQGLKEFEKYIKSIDGNIVSIYLDCPLQIRLQRSLNREHNLTDDKCLEICRRALDDNENVAIAKNYCTVCLNNETEANLLNNVYFIDTLARGMMRGDN